MHFHSYFISDLLVSLISTISAIVFAVISYYCIEVHFLKLKRFFKDDRTYKSLA